MKKVILKVLKYFFIVIFVLFVSMVCLQRFSNNRISMFNFRLFTVISGSMEPKYKIGDVLVAVETKPEDVKVGDVISYLGNKGSFADKVITHQVIKIEKSKDGKLEVHYKGIPSFLITDVSDISDIKDNAAKLPYRLENNKIKENK